MHWRIKGLIQKVLGPLPGGEALHYRLQRRFGGLQNFHRELSVKVEDWQIMVRHLRDANVSIPSSHFFEIGTGWYPTFPFALYLAGARRITTYDLNRHLQDDLVRAAVKELGGFLKVIAEDSGSDLAEVQARYQILATAVDAGADLSEATGGKILYSDRAWKLWNNAFLYQNRMRAHEFVEGAAALGFAIELDTSTARANRLEQLAAMKVDSRFAQLAAEKLCITSVDFIARKPA